MVSASLNLAKIACGIFTESLAAFSIQRASSEKVKIQKDPASRRGLYVGENSVDLNRLKHIRVIAAGKAATPMLEELLPYLHDLPHCDLSGMLVTAECPAWLPHSLSSSLEGILCRMKLR
jgi:glycerate 2-kinase